jgi:hypothetical protein
MSPFDFNRGNSQVNSYYYAPQRSTDAFLYNSPMNPTETSWGSIGPSNYFGEFGQGFARPAAAPLGAPIGSSQGYNFSGQPSGSRNPAGNGFFSF